MVCGGTLGTGVVTFALTSCGDFEETYPVDVTPLNPSRAKWLQSLEFDGWFLESSSG